MTAPTAPAPTTPAASTRPSAVVERVRRHPVVLAGMFATVAALALIAIGAQPTGVDTPEGTVPDNGRLAAMVPVHDDRVLLVSRAGALEVHVAYPGPKGWLSVQLPAAPSNAVAAWAASPGEGPLEPLAVVYGRAAGVTAVVEWNDGRIDEAELASDGVYLVAREGRAVPSRVAVIDADGETVFAVTDL